MFTQAPSSAPAAAASATPAEPIPLVMQIIVDGSSSDLQSWPKGPWMAQAAHAAIAAIQISSSSPASQEYVSESNLASMHKVVLQTPKEGKAKMSLQDLSEKLSEARKVYEEGGEQGEEFPKHHLWVEQPEGLATCLALAPNRKPAALKKILRPCTLLKD